MGVVIETCVKYPRGPTRMKGTDMQEESRGFSAAWVLRYSSPFLYPAFAILTGVLKAPF
jgi:hypothetical protein